MSAALDHRTHYRLPWSLPDNAISWLEITSKCNLACEGCYRANDPDGHKPLEQIEHELDVFQRLRRSDAVSIAGGDPLLHPRLVEVVRSIARRGVKPVLNTNGLALTPELLRELAKAGLLGVTFHIDSKQHRPGWKEASEGKLNELRLEFAEMARAAGRLACGFNATVYPDTLEQVPEVVEWGHRHIEVVHNLVFIAFRAANSGGFDYYAGADRVDMGKAVYLDADGGPDITSNDIHATIRKRFPAFSSCAYLNGTEDPESFKWLLSCRIGNRHEIYGYAGPKFLELAQTSHHLVHGHYLGYSRPSTHRRAKWMLLLAPLDRGVRKAAAAFFRSLARRPSDLVRPLHLQAVMIIQPVDTMPSGVMSMCDGCPDVTVWEDKLVWSCRLDEPMKFGCFLRAVPRPACRERM
jgi:pyruvate-formate lyase-activating enzyme